MCYTTPLQTKRNLKRNKQTNTHHSGLCKESDRDRSSRRANSNKILHLAERKKCISAYHVLLLFDTVNDARKPNQSTTYDTTNPNVNVTINSPTISVESGTDANLKENLHKTQFLFILLNSFQSTKRAHTHTHTRILIMCCCIWFICLHDELPQCLLCLGGFCVVSLFYRVVYQFSFSLSLSLALSRSRSRYLYASCRGFWGGPSYSSPSNSSVDEPNHISMLLHPHLLHCYMILHVLAFEITTKLNNKSEKLVKKTM